MKKKLIYSAHTEKGLREKNEDNFFVGINESNQMLIVVCDGVGGDSSSQIASEIVVNAFKINFKKQPTVKEFKDFYNISLELGLKYINEVSEKLFKNNEKMGTTVNAALIDGDKVYCANIGDSHTYHFLSKENKIQLVSQDQNLLNFIKIKYAKERELHPEDLDNIALEEERMLKQYHDQLSALTHCVENDSKLTSDMSNYNSFVLEKHDQVVLCTDGVYNFITGLDFIASITTEATTEENFQDCAGQIILKSLKNNSNDNLTVVIAKYHE
jgi:protein phosphatase